MSAASPPSPPPRRRGLKVALAVLNGLLALAYPLVVYLGLSHLGTREVGLLIAAVVGLGVLVKLPGQRRATLWPIVRMPLAIVALVLLGVVLDDARFVLAMPVLVSAVMWLAFAATLRRPRGDAPARMSMVERFARLQDPELSDEKVAWCRRWTAIWCVFFVINGLIAGALAGLAPLSWWALYAGLVAYVLIGALFAVERVLRRRRFGT